MALFKCKMCGGSLEPSPDATVISCEYCGTQQTLPKLTDDKISALYDRANHFRRNNEFDKAMAIYEQILNEDSTDAEIYWSLVLCRYGIEYVEDPTSHKRIPTVHRAQYTSIYDDTDYQSAIEYADASQRMLYENEAKAINEIQKGILSISQKEDPFDIFICYKESDENGKRTPDSVLAQELYFQLTNEGFKVFFARITLESKLGAAYEPYIFAALNSSKIMVVLGTKPEYFNAVWVKNEWSRYLSLIRQGEKKVLIPAYKGMNPYDLPDEFTHLQAQDMSKLGFMQDLIHGINKILKIKKTPEPAPTMMPGDYGMGKAPAAQTEPLLKRAFLFLEEGNWLEANNYCEKVLDADPENAQAYLAKLMAEHRVRTREQLAASNLVFDGGCPLLPQDNNNYHKIIRFGDQALIDFVMEINERNKRARKQAAYDQACQDLSTAAVPSTLFECAEAFESVGDFLDAPELARECREKGELIFKTTSLRRAKEYMRKKSYKQAIPVLEKIQGWEDADECLKICRHKQAALEKNSKKKNTIIVLIVIGAVVILPLLPFLAYLLIYLVAIVIALIAGALGLVIDGTLSDFLDTFSELSYITTNAAQFLSYARYTLGNVMHSITSLGWFW